MSLSLVRSKDFGHTGKEASTLAEDQVDTEVGSIRDSRALELVFKGLWERVRKVAKALEELREEKKSLQATVRALEEQVSNLRQELGQKEQTLRELKGEQRGVVSRNNIAFTVKEKEALKGRIKELLAKINSHL